MAKVQGKKAAAAGKSAAKKVVARVKAAAGAAKKKASPKKPPAPAKTAVKKPAAKAVAKPASKPAKKPVAKPAGKAAAKAKAAAKSVRSVTKKAVAKLAKPVSGPKATAKAPVKTAAKAAVKTAPVKPMVKAARPAAAKAPKPAPSVAPAPVAARPVAAPAAAVAPEPEKKRGRRARPRVQSNGIPTAAWLTSEKPRPASFIPAPARAEAPSAIAAPPASSDRLIRPEDVVQSAIRSVPVRIDIEQGAGRFYVLSNPTEATVRVGEGIEWDFRYIGGADVTAEEIVIEFPKPSPFGDAVFRTRKPGGARPHRQASGAALPAAAGKRIEYTVRAMTQFKTELAHAKMYVTIV